MTMEAAGSRQPPLLFPGNWLQTSVGLDITRGCAVNFTTQPRIMCISE